MGEALYRKYRPQSLDDVVGQPHITKTLSTALKEGKISHGYLFSGPRGVGKTSIARILAHQVNSFEYGDPRGALDIIEIDAASNRRIDEIRELRDKVHLAPVAGNYKVYIIDEVHMLTREAFNALLKTLEEPPAHVIFILATTEAHKLPETIVSRTQRHTFKSVASSEVVHHLQTLAKKEKVKIDDTSLELIARHGEGSFRDSISLLDQLSILGTVTKHDVEQALGIPPEDTVDQLLAAIEEGNLRELNQLITDAHQAGVSATKLAHGISTKLKNGLLENPAAHKANITFIDKLLSVSVSPNPNDKLEVILYDACLTNIQAETLRTEHKKTPSKAEPTKPVAAHKETAEPKTTPKIKPAQKPVAKAESEKPQPTVKLTDSTNAEEIWNKVLESIRKNHNTLYGVARMATPAIEDGDLVLYVPFAFHKKRLSSETSGRIISETVQSVTGKAITIRSEVRAQTNQAEQNNNIPAPESSDTLQAVTDIFGGGEVLES
jgi:DNA polymerase-3 subunit gamma/tau